jgi:hypothetical protein
MVRGRELRCGETDDGVKMAVLLFVAAMGENEWSDAE